MWHCCKSVEERRGRRKGDLEKRRAFKRAVRKARKSYENEKCTELGGPSRCWQGFDNEGVVRIEKEAVAVRREHFEELLNGEEI